MGVQCSETNIGSHYFDKLKLHLENLVLWIGMEYHKRWLGTQSVCNAGNETEPDNVEIWTKQWG